MSIERPLDMLNKLKGSKVEVIFKDGRTPAVGILVTFDIHINIVLDGDPQLFLRGDNIHSIAEARKK